MKASMRIGKGSANHNDRSFDLSKAKHIDKDKVHEEKTIFLDIPQNPFEEDLEEFEKTKKKEIEYYGLLFQKRIEKTNKKYLQNRHPEKCTSAEKMYHSKQYEPHEMILQVGDKNEHINSETLQKIVDDFLKNSNIKYPNLKMMDYSLHVSEATPHIHFRFVIVAINKNGDLEPALNKGLKQMEIHKPDLSAPESKFNNPLMTFSKSLRDDFYAEIEKNGIQIDRTPTHGQKHISKQEYILAKKQAELNAVEQTLVERSERIQEALDYINSGSVTQDDIDMYNKFEVIKGDVKNDLIEAATIGLNATEIWEVNHSLEKRCKELERANLELIESRDLVKDLETLDKTKVLTENKKLKKFIQANGLSEKLFEQLGISINKSRFDKEK